MKICRKNIKDYYENLISDVKDKKRKEELLDDLEEIDDWLLSLENNIEKELEKQEDDYLPSQNEMLDDFEACRKEIML